MRILVRKDVGLDIAECGRRPLAACGRKTATIAATGLKSFPPLLIRLFGPVFWPIHFG
ncbi:hypothetical protein MES5069_510011 [Mesorhizobium escarrei]|uniref:Uncharacterized protein n=1 Tax=Mesorhizobium escarrei TaxID=666018 RepID=A0ABN8K706_9HYPH|nr:hypothetical protein MES5069_510011 [Mesorhizobium escarrei]